MKLVFLGPPGAGKGTQADMICKKYDIPHISTGDMLRAEIKAGTPLGLKAKEFMDKGELVTDEVILGMVANRVSEPDCEKGFLFDGFPRTIKQAEALQNIAKIDKVINIDVPAKAVVERISGRRTCSVCGAGYHISTYAKDVCEKCGSKLVIRDDDKPETVENRIRVYEEKTKPLIDFYAKVGGLCTVDGVGTMDEVFSRIVNAIEAK